MGRKVTIFKVYEGNTLVFEGTAIDVSTKYAMSLKSVWRYAKEKKLVLEKYLIVDTSDKKGTYIANDVRKGRTSEDVEKKIVEDYKSNRFGNDKKLAEEYNISMNALNRVLVKYGLRTFEEIFHYTDKKRIDVGKVGALYKANWSIEKIADEFIAKPQTIREILEDASFTKLNRDM